jgi:hypothetical protein
MRWLVLSLSLLLIPQLAIAQVPSPFKRVGTIISPVKSGDALRMSSGDLRVRSSGAAFDLKLGSSEVLTGDRQLSITVGNAARALSLGGDVTTAGALTTSGAFDVTFTATAATGVTLPTSGTLYGTATGSITSANLLGSLSDETGTGTAVFSISPAITGTMTAEAVTATGLYTLTKASQASVAEALITATVSDDATGGFFLENSTSTDASFAPRFRGVHAGAGVGLNFQGRSTTDTGVNGCLQFTGQIGTSDVAVRPVMTFYNRATLMAQFSPQGNLQLTTATTSKTLATAAADSVFLADVDNGAGNRELQVQPESGGYFAMGGNRFRRVATANQDVYHWATTVNTTAATETTIATIPITASRTYFVETIITARRTGGVAGTADDGASYVRRGTYTTKAGTVTLMGSVQTIGTDAEDQAGWDTTLTISGTNVLVRGTGAADNHVTWQANTTVQSVGQ